MRKSEGGEPSLRVFCIGWKDKEREFLTSLLQTDDGCFAVSGADGYDGGVQQVADDSYDVVLLDARRDEAKAFSILRQVAGQESNFAPVIMIAGSPDRVAEQRMIEAGAADVLAVDQLSPPLLKRAIRYVASKQRSKADLSRLTLHDPDTGLPTETLFWEVLSLALARAHRNKNFLAVLVIYIKDFTIAGEPLEGEGVAIAVQTVAVRLKNTLRASDTVARFHGNRFIVLAESMPESEGVQVAAERIVERLEEPVDIAGLRAKASCHIGISLYPVSGHSAEALVRSAEEAMIHAKEQGLGFHFL
jgi:diguanylate cyclase (GGDEF)-like protein